MNFVLMREIGTLTPLTHPFAAIAYVSHLTTKGRNLMCDITIRLTAPLAGAIVAVSHIGMEVESSSAKRHPYPIALRFFCARLLSYGREGDGYNTPQGERSPPGFARAFNLPATQWRRVKATPLRFLSRKGVATP